MHCRSMQLHQEYQFYNTTVEPTLKSQTDKGCETWLHFNGQQYCDSDLASSSGDPVNQEYVMGVLFAKLQGADIVQTCA